MNTAQF